MSWHKLSTEQSYTDIIQLLFFIFPYEYPKMEDIVVTRELGIFILGLGGQ